MNYEVQQALSNKVDTWKFNALQQEVYGLQSENRNLRENLSILNNRVQNHYSAIEQLIQILIDNDVVIDTDQLFNIRQYL